MAINTLQYDAQYTQSQINPYVHFVIWGFCWREGSRYLKVFGNYSLLVYWTSFIIFGNYSLLVYWTFFSIFGNCSLLVYWTPFSIFGPPTISATQWWFEVSVASVSFLLIIDTSDLVVLPCFLHMVDFWHKILVTLFWVWWHQYALKGFFAWEASKKIL